MVEDAGLSGLGIFTPALIGLPVLLSASLVILLSAPWLLPKRENDLQRDSGLRQFTVELVVAAGSSVAGKTVEQAGLRHLQGAYLISVLRAGGDLGLPQPGLVLNEGDRLIFSGERTGVSELAARKGLTLASDHRFRADSTGTPRILVEVLLPQHSSLIGQSVNQAGFRTRFRAALVALSHGGERVAEGIGDYVLRPGDILLLENGVRIFGPTR